MSLQRADFVDPHGCAVRLSVGLRRADWGELHGCAVRLATGRLLLGINPERGFWHTVELLSLRCAD